MSSQCTVCRHDKTHEINQKIVEGVPHTEIARQFDLNNQAVRRHSINHLPEKTVQAHQIAEKQHSEDLLDTIQGLLDKSRNIMDEAIQSNDQNIALKAIKESRNTVQLMAKIANQLEKYRREDEKKQSQQAEQHIQEGLECLTEQELETFLALQAKIYQHDSEKVLTEEQRNVVRYYREMTHVDLNGGFMMDKQLVDNQPDAQNRDGSHASQKSGGASLQAKKDENKTENDFDDDLGLDSIDLDT